MGVSMMQHNFFSLSFSKTVLYESAYKKETQSSFKNAQDIVSATMVQSIRFDEIGTYLDHAGFRTTKGTIVDATIVSAPTSTQNRLRSRDPEMSSTGGKTTNGISA